MTEKPRTYKTKKDEIIWENVLLLAEKRSLQKNHLADKIGIKPQHITKIERGITGIGPKTLKKIVIWSGYPDASFLMVPLPVSKQVAIISIDEALQFAYLSDKWPDGVSKKGDTVIPHVETGISAFGVQVPDGFGMEPRFLKGDILIIDPGAEVKSGDFCLIEINGELKCRVIELGMETRLRALNEKYAEIIIRPGVDFRIIGKVVDMIPEF